MDSDKPKQTVLAMPADLRALWHVLIEKVWVVVGILAICTAAGFFYAIRLPRIYEATATVQVEADGQTLMKVENRKSEEPANEIILKTIEQNLRSPALALRLIRHPEVKSDPAFLRGIARPASEEHLSAALSSEITARVRPGTRLVDITVEDESPAMAQKLAGLLVEEFLRASADGRVALAQGANTYLREEADRLKARLAKSEHAIQQYKEQHQAVSLEDKQNIVVERLKELNVKVTTAKSERLRLETDFAQIQTMAGKPPDRLLALSSIASSPAVSELRRKLGEKETEFAALTRRYKAEHPKYIQTSSELQELRTSLDEAIQNAGQTMSVSLDAAKLTEGKLEEALHAQENLALALSKMAIPYEALEREVVSDRALYDSLLGRLKESEIGQDVSQYSVRMVSPPMLPELPSKPKKSLILLMSVAAGLGIALSFVLGSSLLDTSLKTVDQSEKFLGRPLLGAIPTAKNAKLEQTRWMLTETPDSAIAETFRALRTSVQLAAPDGAFRCVLFTSGIPGEGKSFCAINYAVALAQQGFRTLLIDADVRLPSIGRVFLGNDDAPGLTDLLLRRRELDEVVRLTDIENLSILAAGTRVPNPAELCGQTSFSEVLQAAKAIFDRIVIDTAPVHAVSETLILAPQADAVCLVVRAGKTPGPVVARALKKLIESGACVPGFVLNGVSTRNNGYYYHYHAPGYGKDEVYGASAAAVRRARDKA